MINSVTLIGNLGADPEMRTTAGGMVIANLRVATTSRKKVGDGKWEDVTEWHAVTVFGKTAENAGQYLSKGRQVYIEGRLQTRKWQDKEGKDRWSTEVVCNELKFLGSKNDSGHNAGGSMSRPAQAAAPSGGGYGGGSNIPF